MVEHLDAHQMFFPERHRDVRRNPERGVRPRFGERHEKFPTPGFHNRKGCRRLEIRRAFEFVVPAERDFRPNGAGSLPASRLDAHFHGERNRRPLVVGFLFFE